MSPTFRDESQRRAALQTATSDLDLTADELLTLDWLAGWSQDTVASVIRILHKARRGTLEPPMPPWVVEPNG